MEMAMAAGELLEAAVQNSKAWQWYNAMWRAGSSDEDLYGHDLFLPHLYTNAAEVAQEAHERQEQAVARYEAAGL